MDLEDQTPAEGSELDLQTNVSVEENATTRSSKSHLQDDEIGFKISLRAEEDIVAELEDFAFLVKLGVRSEAKTLLYDVLWDHLDHFAVVAEAVQFLVDEINPREFILDLLLTLRERSIEFTNVREARFIDVLRAVYRHDPLRAPFDSSVAERNLDELKLRLANGLDATVELQLQDLCFIATHGQSTIGDRLKEATAHHECLIQSGYAWEVVRHFGVMCKFVESRLSVASVHKMYSVYLGTRTWLDSDHQQLQSLTEEERLDQDFCHLWLGIWWLRYMDANSFTRISFPMVRREIYDRANNILSRLFKILPDTEPRGELVQFLRESQDSHTEQSLLPGEPRIQSRTLTTASRSLPIRVPQSRGSQKSKDSLTRQVPEKSHGEGLEVADNPFSDLVAGFMDLSAGDYNGLVEFCHRNPAIWSRQQELKDFPNRVKEWLKQGQAEEAYHYAERYLLLQIAQIQNFTAVMGNDFLKELDKVEGRRELFENSVFELLRQIEDLEEDVEDHNEEIRSKVKPTSSRLFIQPQTLQKQAGSIPLSRPGQPNLQKEFKQVWESRIERLNSEYLEFLTLHGYRQ